MAWRGRLGVPLTVGGKNEWENKKGSCDGCSLGGGSVVMIDSTLLIPVHPRLNPPGCHSELRHNEDQLRCKCPHRNDFFPPNCHSFECRFIFFYWAWNQSSEDYCFSRLFHFIVHNWQDFHSLLIVLPRWPIRIPAFGIRWVGWVKIESWS